MKDNNDSIERPTIRDVSTLAEATLILAADAGAPLEALDHLLDTLRILDAACPSPISAHALRASSQNPP